MTLFAAADCYQRALRMNGRHTVGRYVYAYWFSFIALAGFILSGSQAVAYIFGIQLVAVTSGDPAPVFQSGDRVLMVRWPLWFGGLPDRGDIIYYTHPAYTVAKPTGDSFRITAVRSFGVVSGLPGDHIAWENGAHPALNGKPMPEEYMPFNPQGLRSRLELNVPPGHMAALLSTGTTEYSLGPSWGGHAGSPAELEAQNMIWKDFEEANMPKPSFTLGVVLLRYNPPERRAWFGFGNGVANHRAH